MTSSQNQPLVESSSLENPRQPDSDNLPFAFARRHGVMVNESKAQELSLISRDKLNPSVLLEIQRHFQKSVKVQAVGSNEFDALLQQSYETQSQQNTIESFDDELDLSGVAEALPEPEDLLEAKMMHRSFD